MSIIQCDALHLLQPCQLLRQPKQRKRESLQSSPTVCLSVSQCSGHLSKVAAPSAAVAVVYLFQCVSRRSGIGNESVPKIVINDAIKFSS